MALTLSMVTAAKVTLANAYVRPVSFRGDKERIIVTVGIFVDEAARKAKAVPVEAFSVRCAHDATKPLMDSVYAALKLDKRFAGAKDC